MPGSKVFMGTYYISIKQQRGRKSSFFFLLLEKMLILSYYHSIQHILRIICVFCILVPEEKLSPIHVVIKIRIITSPLYIRKKSMDANKDKISSQTKKRKEKKIYIVSHYYLYFLIVSQCSLYRTTVISYRGKVITKRISNNLHLPTRL